MFKKWLKKRKDEKEKYRMADEEEKRFYAGLAEHVVENTDTNMILLKKLLEIISVQLGETEPLTDINLKLGDDLYMDSLNKMELIMATEEEFDVEIEYWESMTDKTTIWELFVLVHYCIFRWKKSDHNM